MARIKKGKVLSMRKIREIFRLAMNCHMKKREIARSCSVGLGTVSNYLNKAKEAGLSYFQIVNMDDQELQQKLKNSGVDAKKNLRPQPDWKWVHQELKKKGVTLQLLWQEYKEDNSDGYQSTQFYEYYYCWKKN